MLSLRYVLHAHIHAWDMFEATILTFVVFAFVSKMVIICMQEEFAQGLLL
jgi:hypothetical protein